MKKNPNERLSLDGVMRHHWITKYAKLDANPTNNVSLNTFASNMGTNASHSAHETSSNSNSSQNHHVKSEEQSSVISNNSTAINTNQQNSANNLTANYLMKSASAGIIPSQTKTTTANSTLNNVKPISKTNQIYASSIYSGANIKKK